MILLAIPLLIPLLIDIAAIWIWRGGYRYGAMIPLPFLVLAFAVDLNGMIQGGNLTGLVTIFVAVPTLVLLLVLAAFQGFAQRTDTTGGWQTLSKRVSLVVLAVLVIVAITVAVYALLPAG